MTLALAAEVCHARGWTTRRLTAEGMRGVLARLGIGWKRAKHWITSSDPNYATKKVAGPADRAGREQPRLGGRVPGRVLVGRLAHPDLFAWAAGDPLRLVGNARDPKGAGGREAAA